MVKVWQYNGVAPFDEILDWCYDHLSDKTWFSNHFETIAFHDDADYTAFMLRWL